MVNSGSFSTTNCLVSYGVLSYEVFDVRIFSPTVGLFPHNNGFVIVVVLIIKPSPD